MSTSALVNWLEEADPYHIQRQAAHKACMIATIMVYVYWIYLPVNFSSYVVAIILMSLYESPNFTSYKEKDSVFIFVVTVVLICSPSFYLMYLDHYLFLLYFLTAVTIVYFIIVKYFYKIKNLSMLIITVSAVDLTQQPEGVLQIAYDIFSGTLLSFAAMYIALKLYPNRYLIIWSKALEKYIHSLELDIEAVIQGKSKLPLSQEVAHIDIVMAYQRLLPKGLVRPSYKLYFCMRNIHFALNNIMGEEVNAQFWQDILIHLHTLRTAIVQRKLSNSQEIVLCAKTPIQQYVRRDLFQGFYYWNQLCAKSTN